jgi:hypothetical protein
LDIYEHPFLKGIQIKNILFTAGYYFDGVELAKLYKNVICVFIFSVNEFEFANSWFVTNRISIKIRFLHG